MERYATPTRPQDPAQGLHAAKHIMLNVRPGATADTDIVDVGEIGQRPEKEIQKVLYSQNQPLDVSI